MRPCMVASRCHIAPGILRGDPDTLRERRGYEAHQIVVAVWAIARAERATRLLPFHALGRDIGVHYTDDLMPYRTWKLRIPNGARTFVAALGLWLGLATVCDATGDPLLGSRVRRVDDVIAPHSERDAGTLRAYTARTSVWRASRDRVW